MPPPAPTQRSIDHAPRVAHAIREIEKQFGDTVSVFEKGKSLLKFGRNEEVSTNGSTIMTLPSGVDNETYNNIENSTNNITTVSSSSTSDTEILTVEGHTVANNLLTFVTQNVTLTGQTQATLTTPLARATRAFATGGTDLVGTIYFYEDDTDMSGVPDTAAKVHLMIPAGRNQSVKASTSLSSQDYWLVTEAHGSVLEKTSVFADFDLQIRRADGVWRQQADFAAQSGAFTAQEFSPFLIIPKNTDIRLVATASANSTDASGGIDGYLAIVTT